MEDREYDNMNEKDKKLIERQNEIQNKDISDEFQETYNRIQSFFTGKLEKNLKRVFEKT